MKSIETYKVPFDIYLPATKFCNKTGLPTNAKFIKTIEVDVYDNFGYQMLTTESSETIEKERTLAYIQLKND